MKPDARQVGLMAGFMLVSCWLLALGLKGGIDEHTPA
jgi:hypothetical protein